MKTPWSASPRAALLAVLVSLSLLARAVPPEEIPEKQIPEALKPWASWVTWDDEHRSCPTPYSDAKKHLCFWPSQLVLKAEPGGGKFELTVKVFHETWVPLPGGSDLWPVEVKANGAPVTVLPHENSPSVKLAAGTVRVEGAFRWTDIPQKLLLPQQIGLLTLTIGGQPVESPVWDAYGYLWLKRDGSTEEADKNFLAVKTYGVIEDGLPLWLRMELELTVAGKSREEEFGHILPEGWKLASVESQLPVAVDDAGRMKAQVRAGRWTIRAHAFRLDHPKEIRFAAGAKPVTPDALMAFRARPEFRVVEVTGVPPVDVSQTTFPEAWRDLPVYRWETAGSIRLEERMRGMGEQKTAGLRIQRELWLDEDGGGLTFRDRLAGTMQKTWRLDAAAGGELGAVRESGRGQLITMNPQTGAPGVEIRTRNLDLEATGRLPRAAALSATGWRSDADELHGQLNLPPGWRLFAMFGVDTVRGDWLTAWTLLDLFLLLVFTLAVFRLWGFGAAVLAFTAFGLAYHEPLSLRYLWLFLLVPLALQRVVPPGRAARFVQVTKWCALGLFVLAFVPFVASQVQQALYPQLEDLNPREQSTPLDVIFPSVRSAYTSKAAMNAMNEDAAMRNAGREEEQAADPSSTQAIQRKLVAIIIPKLEFREATIRSAIDFLQQKARELDTDPDPARRGVNIVLRLDAGPGPVSGMIPGAIPGLVDPAPPGAAVPAIDPNEARITISLNNVPLGEALRYVTNLAGLKYKVEPHAIYVVPLSTPTDTLVTKEWKVPPGMFSPSPTLGPEERTGSGIARRLEARDYLTAAGITFPPGASAIFLPGSSRLIVKNTQENLDLIDNITDNAMLVGPSTTGGDPMPGAAAAADATKGGSGLAFVYRRPETARYVSENLNYDPKARIQTGPGVPQWQWRSVTFGWNGPVAASQQVKPWLISLALERVLTVLRVGLLLALAAVMIGNRRLELSLLRRFRKAAVVALFLGLTSGAWAQGPMPDTQMLEKLRSRLLKKTDAYPSAADIPFVTLTLTDRQIITEAEIHAADRVAVPLPGRFPQWSPVSVAVDDKPAAALRRDDNYLWVLIEPGIHRVRVEGSLANVTEWEWTFVLKPHQVKIEAPDWTFTGVNPAGVPEEQVLFSRKEKAVAGAAVYEQQEVQAVAQVDRVLELGLIWQSHTIVTRLSPPGRAVALRVPLLPGESVLTPGAIVRDGFVEVRLSAQEQSYQWESGLATVPKLKLATRAEDTWVERWSLIASPVWNVTLTGLPPVYDAAGGDLTPSWQPWRGEQIELAINRPTAIAGATVTVDFAEHEIAVGHRQRTSKLSLYIRCSLAEDFLVELPAEAEITALTQDTRPLPVRKDGRRLIIPLRPGGQRIVIEWKTNAALGFLARADEVRLPVESANIHTTMQVPDNRWVLGAAGPRRGPAVRFWGILICALIAALALGRPAGSPLRPLEWMLLAVGLTQIPPGFALVVVGWLFLLGWRGSDSFQRRGWLSYNLLQLSLILLTAVALGVLLATVGEGLLGHPEMFITGNRSSRTMLRWYQAHREGALPHPVFISISIWWYRFAMLVWALWLAAALLGWLRRGWQSFGRGGFWRKSPPPVLVPPRVRPTASAPAGPTPPPLHGPAGPVV